MKKLICFLLLSLAIYPLTGSAQSTDGSDSARSPENQNATEIARNMDAAKDMSHPLKTNDEWLSRWAIDFNFRAGQLNQIMRMKDPHDYYPESLKRSIYHDPVYNDGITTGGDVSLNYFFSANRRWGVSFGAMYLKHKGTATIDAFLADYKATFKSGADLGKHFRQIIHSNGSIVEKQITTSVNIPVLIKYKWSFAGRGKRPGFGINIEGGPIFGVQNTTKSEATGNFSYEAIYSLSGDKNSVIFGLDTSIINGIGNSAISEIYTEASYRKNHQDVGLITARFDQARDDGKNVGLNHNIAPNRTSQTSHYNQISLGAMVQAGISYQFSYNVAFLLNGYFIYQDWSNNADKNHRMTESVDQYNGSYYSSDTAFTEVMGHSYYSAYGLSAGIRLSFGERADVDNDGVKGKDDLCPDIWGIKEFQGCPDSDGDGIPDKRDRCPNKAGLLEFDGCPDTDGDGIPDEYDKCPLVAGTYNGCPPLATNIVSTSSDTSIMPYDTLTALPNERNTGVKQYVLLNTSVIYFEFDSSNISDAASGVLAEVKSILEQNDPRTVICVSGHADNIGSDRNNSYISFMRARAARNYLIKLGVPPERIIMGNYGKENPVSPNDTPENRARNRRIELMLFLPLK